MFTCKVADSLNAVWRAIVLLGIKLDDKLLLEREFDVLSLRHSSYLSSEAVLGNFEPYGRFLSLNFSKFLELNAVAAVFLNNDNVAGLNEKRGDVYVLAVKSKVCVKNELTSFLSCRSL